MSVSSVQSLSRVQLFTTPWTLACQASLSLSNYLSLLKLRSIEWVMPPNHLIFCHPLLLPSIFPSIRNFSNVSILHIRWPKNWSFSFSISPSNEHPALISFRIDWFDFQSLGLVWFPVSFSKLYVWIYIYCAYAAISWKNRRILRNVIHKMSMYSLICICGYEEMFTMRMMPAQGETEKC